MRVEAILGGADTDAARYLRKRVRIRGGCLRGADGTCGSAYRFLTLHWAAEELSALEQAVRDDAAPGEEVAVSGILGKVGGTLSRYLWQPLWAQRRAGAGPAARRRLEPEAEPRAEPRPPQPGPRPARHREEGLQYAPDVAFDRPQANRR